MKKKVLKLLALGLCASMCFSMVACSKDKEDESKSLKSSTESSSVSENSEEAVALGEWWEPTMYSRSGYGTTLEEMRHITFIGKTQSDEVVLFEDSVLSSDGTKLTFVPFQGGSETVVDLASEIAAYGINSSFLSFLTPSIVDGEVHVNISAYDDTTMDEVQYTMIVDATSKTVTSIEESSFSPEGADYGRNIGEYRIEGTHSYDNATINVIDSTGAATAFDLNQLFPEKNIAEIRDIIPLGDSDALIAYTSYNEYDTVHAVSINLVSSSIADSSVDEDLLNEVLMHDSWVYDENLGICFCGSGKIYSVDFIEGTKEEIFDFNSTNVNWSMIPSYSLISCEEDRIILGGIKYFSNEAGFWSDFSLLTLEKSETNPNQGKTILKLASLSPEEELSYELCEGVVDFNNSSSTCFIVRDDRYTPILSSDNEGFYSEIETITNRLMVDLISSEGPDILINGFDNSALYGAEYLVDLSDMIPETVNSHIIDLAKTGDCLYQLPISFSLAGIFVNSENYGGEVGFTYESYEDYVSNYCYGESLFFVYNQQEVLFRELCSNYDLIAGAEEFNSDELSMLASFVNDNFFPDTSMMLDPYELESMSNMDIFEGQPGYHEINSFMEILMYSNMRLMGLPSSNPRGASIIVEESVAISSCCSDIEGAKEFVSSVLSDDVQRASNYLPVSEGIFDEMLAETIALENERINELMADPYFMSIDPELTLIPDSFAEDITSAIDLSSSIYMIDPSVRMIIFEELPSFFEGQKTIEEALGIIEDRIDTMISERE